MSDLIFVGSAELVRRRASRSPARITLLFFALTCTNMDRRL